MAQVPSWDPERAHEHSLKQYILDITDWLLTSPVTSDKIVPMLIRKLHGVAKQIGQDLTLAEKTVGGSYNGKVHNPLELLIAKLEDRFGVTDGEAEAMAALEWERLQKKQGETVETYIARFELARMKAAREANIL